jgi:hypothetical protein
VQAFFFQEAQARLADKERNSRTGHSSTWESQLHACQRELSRERTELEVARKENDELRSEHLRQNQAALRKAAAYKDEVCHLQDQVDPPASLFVLSLPSLFESGWMRR